MDHTTWLLVIGFLLPILAAVLKQGAWSDQANALVALVVYVGAGLVDLVVTGQPLTLDAAGPDIAIVAATGTVAYMLFWDNMGKSAPGLPSWDEIITDITSVWKHGPKTPATTPPATPTT